MERLLLLWDELDDLAGACRHLALAAADELAGVAAPLAAAACALAGGLLALHLQAHIALASPQSVPWIG
ncbi:MAG TPA: hypothetical protein VMD49_05885 [Steroidobacteraceae bacterium]|nr:hypothetical protein [Steroidobacteraceae bacterium]